MNEEVNCYGVCPPEGRHKQDVFTGLV